MGDPLVCTHKQNTCLLSGPHCEYFLILCHCSQKFQYDVATGALSLSGYSVSTTQSVSMSLQNNNVTLSNVFLVLFRMRCKGSLIFSSSHMRLQLIFFNYQLLMISTGTCCEDENVHFSSGAFLICRWISTLQELQAEPQSFCVFIFDDLYSTLKPAQ